MRISVHKPSWSLSQGVLHLGRGYQYLTLCVCACVRAPHTLKHSSKGMLPIQMYLFTYLFIHSFNNSWFIQ